MSYQATAYQVMIASPSDVIIERNLAKEIVYNWNAIHSYDKKILLLPVSWETNSAPKMGNRPQEIINRQILESSDLLIGIFWSRLGTHTGEAVSGTVEEITKHVDSGKPAMLYFSNVPVVLDSVDRKQYDSLQLFKNECQKKGLIEIYDSIDEFSNKLSRQLGIIINKDEYFNKGKLSHIEKIIEEENEFNFIEVLFQESKELLVKTSKDPRGTVIKVRYIGGFDIQTNGNNLNTDDSPKTWANWDAAFEQLLAYDLIKDNGTKGEVYSLTMNGYKLAEYLIDKLNYR